MASDGRLKVGILMVVENLPVPFDRRVWAEARALRDTGYTVSIICPKGRGYTRSREVLEGIKVYRHPLPVQGAALAGYIFEYSVALFFQFVLSIWIKMRHGYNIIHICNPPDFLFLSCAIMKVFGVKIVFDHHDLCPELFIAKFNRKGAFYRLMLFFEKLTFRIADVSIATNQSYREIAICRNGMHPDRVFVVRSGPDLNRVKARAPNHKWRNGREILVGYVGVIGNQEGLDLLVEAAEHIVTREGIKHIQFVVVGDGEERAIVEKLVEARGLSDFFSFPGSVEDAVLFEILSTADICVNPDRPNEMNDKSTMNKIMEYMVLGKPIVQFDLKEGRFSAGEASLYANNTDTTDFAAKIILLAKDRELRDKMGRSGRIRVEKELAWQFQVENLLSAYDKVREF